MARTIALTSFSVMKKRRLKNAALLIPWMSVLIFASFSTFVYLAFTTAVSTHRRHVQVVFEAAASSFYNKRHSVDCALIFANNGTESQPTAAGLIEKDFSLWKKFGDCSEVRHRYFYPETPASEEESRFPLAYSIVVNQDLQHKELLLSAIYAPQNTYCFHIDLKATQVFSDGLRRLASCFPNVIFSTDQFSVTSYGANMVRAYRSCIDALVRANAAWKYVFTLQGQDFPLRTNRELVRIAKILRGANDIELLPAASYRWEKHYEVVYDDSNGLLLDLNLGKEIKKSTEPLDGLSLYKGSVSASMSRPFVEFILNNINATKLVDWLDNSMLLADELYWATLNHNDESFPVPGGYPGRCYTIGRKDWLTRFTVWQDYSGATCHGSWRHGICIFGAGDLPLLAKRPEMFLNKFITQSDPVPSICMHELLYNRTHYPHLFPSDSHGFNQTWYETSAPVTFQLHSSLHLPSSNFTCVPCTFNCEH